MSRLVLTGATGFLGAALLDELDLDGAIALTRGPAPELEARGIEVRPVGFGGELPEGCRIVHMAGKVDFSADGQKAMLDLHVEGTRQLCQAALKAKCSKFVLLSSSGTTAVSKVAKEMDENDPYPLEIISRWPYYLSKLYQERLVLDLCRREGLPAVVVNPSLLLGPGDARGGSTQIVHDFLNGKIPLAPAGGIGMVDVRDTARATAAALEAGRVGERYFLGSWNTTFAHFFEVLARIADKPAPVMASPRGLAPAGARVLTAVLGKAKTEAMSPAKMEMAEHFWYVNWSKATAELGFAPRRPEATLRDTVADIRRNA